MIVKKRNHHIIYVYVKKFNTRNFWKFSIDRINDKLSIFLFVKRERRKIFDRFENLIFIKRLN